MFTLLTTHPTFRAFNATQTWEFRGLPFFRRQVTFRILGGGLDPSERSGYNEVLGGGLVDRPEAKSRC
eukprot:5680404-Pyramimonas_sp.AAC.2